MRRLAFIAVVVFASSLSPACFAQAKTDSLERKLNTLTGRERLPVLSDLIGATRRPDPNRAKKYFDEFEKIYLESDKPVEFKSLYYHIKGEVLMRDGKYDEARRDLTLSIEEAQKSHDHQMLWSSYNSLGAAYEETGNQAEALKAFLNGYKVAEHDLDESALAGSALNVGTVYGGQQQFGEALKYFRQSLHYHARSKASWGLGNSLNNVGQVHMLLGHTDSAVYYFNKALLVWKIISDDYGVAMTSFNIGSLDASSKNYTRAEIMFRNSLDISEKISDQFGITQNLAALSSLYLEQGKEKEGLEYLQRSIEYSKKNNILSTIRDNYKVQYEYFKKKNDARRALEAHENYFVWYDSLNNSSKTRNFQELQSKFETEKKEKEILQQKAQIDKQHTQRNFLMAGIVLVLVSLVLILRSSWQKHKANVIITQQKKEVEDQKGLLEVKQKEILDSIHYAKRIQQSLLPNDTALDRMLKKARRS